MNSCVVTILAASTRTQTKAHEFVHRHPSHYTTDGVIYNNDVTFWYIGRSFLGRGVFTSLQAEKNTIKQKKRKRKLKYEPVALIHVCRLCRQRVSLRNMTGICRQGLCPCGDRQVTPSQLRWPSSLPKMISKWGSWGDNPPRMMNKWFYTCCQWWWCCCCI